MQNFGSAGHLISHIKNPGLRKDNMLHVVGVMTNHQGWHSRLRLARQWIKHMVETPNVRLHIVEAVYKQRSYELSPELNGYSEKDYDYIPLVTNHHGWLKESLINYGFSRAIHRESAKNLAHIDMDVFFKNQNSWAQSALHALQVFPILQPWSHAVDLGPHNQILLAPTSFGFVQQNAMPLKIQKAPQYSYPHPGYAWCCTSEFFHNVIGLLDFCIVGNADWHMAWCAAGRGEETLRHRYPESYIRRVLDWQRRATPLTNKQVGYIEGYIEHPFHGSKVNRYYIERAQILVKTKYDPDLHLMKDSNGLVLIHNNPELDFEMMKYGQSRKEDSIDI